MQNEALYSIKSGKQYTASLAISDRLSLGRSPNRDMLMDTFDNDCENLPTGDEESHKLIKWPHKISYKNYKAY